MYLVVHHPLGLSLSLLYNGILKQKLHLVLNVLLVHQHVSVASLAVLHIHNSLVSVLHGSLLDPRLDVLLNSKLKHLLDIGGRSDKAAAELELTLDESEGVDGRKLTRVGSTDLDKVAAVTEELEVVAEGHLAAGNSADNQVNTLGVLVRPALIIVSSDVRVGAESKDLISLGSLTGDTDDLVSTKGLGEENTKVTQTTNTDDTDSLSRTAAVVAEGGVDGDTTAEHGSGDVGGKTLGDLDDEARVGTVVVGVSTVGLADAVGVDGAVGADHLGAVVDSAGGALSAVLSEAAAGLSAYTDAVTDLDVLDILTDLDGLADDFVTDTAGFMLLVIVLWKSSKSEVTYGKVSRPSQT